MPDALPSPAPVLHDAGPARPAARDRDPTPLLGMVPAAVGILVGTGVYGLAIGIWRSPLQALFTGLKLPAILLATAAGNSLISYLLAPLLGCRLRFREALDAALTTFAGIAGVLGCVAPVVAFLVLTVPGAEASWDTRSRTFYLLQSSQVACIAAAGITAVVRLRSWLVVRTGDRSIARRILAAWLTLHFLLGSQLTWILRPFFGQHAMPVQFLRPDPLDGNFFETVAFSLQHLLQHTP